MSHMTYMTYTSYMTYMLYKIYHLCHICHVCKICHICAGPSKVSRVEMKVDYLMLCSRASDNPAFIWFCNFPSRGSRLLCDYQSRALSNVDPQLTPPSVQHGAILAPVCIQVVLSGNIFDYLGVPKSFIKVMCSLGLPSPT